MTTFQLTGQIILLVLLVVFSLIMSLYDIKSLAVPDWPYWIGCILIIIVRIIFYSAAIYLNLLSAFILFALYFVVRLITKKHFGTGDVYFGLFQGLCLAPQVLWICLAVEAFTGLVTFGIIYLVKKLKGIKIAFIPFMSIGLLTAFILDWLVI